MTDIRPPKPETLEEWRAKCREMMLLLIESRDAIPAILLSSAKLRGISLSLADRFETCLKPWEIPPETPWAI